MTRYVCSCGAGGAHPEGLPAPFCHRCAPRVRMVRVQPAPGAFSPDRAQHQRTFPNDGDWRWLNCRTACQDFGTGGSQFGIDAGYCLDRYSRIEFHGMPGYKGKQ